MPIKWAPPWLKALGGDASPLKDEAWVHDDLAKLKARSEAEDRMASGQLFAGPLAPKLPPSVPSPQALGEILPSRQKPLLPPPGPTEPTPPVPPAAIDQVTGMPTQVQGGGFLAPPGAPPPPPPADRPPGAFHFPPPNEDHDAARRP